VPALDVALGHRTEADDFGVSEFRPPQLVRCRCPV
jgi:hypothetical protein